MIDKSTRPSSNINSKHRPVLGQQSGSSHRPPIPPISNQIQSESGFYDTLRVYTERLKQERDNSLTYLKKINQMSQELRKKDLEIARLSKSNKELVEKLSIYQSVLNKSRAHANPLRMSNVIDKQNMLQSIIQYGPPEGEPEPSVNRQNLVIDKRRVNEQSKPHFKPLIEQAREVKQKSDFFQQFFIVSPGPDDQVVYQYKFNQNAKKTQESIKIYVQHPQFVLKPYQGNPIKTANKRILFLADSPYTSMKRSTRPIIPLVDEVNSSYYYFGFCILQKELMNMNGKYFWVPMVYGFISYYPFPQYFLKTLETIAREFPNVKDHKVLQQSLKQLNSSLNQIIKNENTLRLPAEIKYNLFNRTQSLKMPILPQMSLLTLSYSKDIFKNYAVELIIDVVMLLLLQIPITVISEDVELLGKFMLYFVCIIKPLKYPFPIVFSLPPSMQILLQSPFPTFIGCTDSSMVDRYISERAVFDLDKKTAKSWPILDHLDLSRQYFMNLIMKHGGQIQKCPLIQQIIDGKNIKDLENYWKDFKQTQIYQLYSHRQ